MAELLRAEAQMPPMSMMRQECLQEARSAAAKSFARKTFRSARVITRSVSALCRTAFVCLAPLIAACGGGGSAATQDQPPTTPISLVTVATRLDVAADQVVMFVGDSKSLTATPRDSTGNILTGKQIAWTSQNPAVATVSTLGALTAVATGTAVIRASIDGVHADVGVTVTPPAATFNDYKAHFPYRASSGRFVVASDIGPSFSQLHLDHLLKVWQLFSGIYARTPGGYTEVYYTRDLAGLYTRILQTCPSIVIPGARNVTTCFDNVNGVYVWFIVPYVEPDYGTQLHEIGHSFLYFTQFDSANWPWFNEGISMYWESGSFSPTGQFSIDQPLPYLRDNFRRVSSTGALVPLSTLQSMNRDEFYGHPDPARVYSQSGMLLYYLHKQYPAVMQGLMAAINGRSVSTNGAVLSHILAQTGLTTSELEQRYTQYALQF